MFTIFAWISRSFWWHSFGLTLYWEKRLAPRAEQCRLDYNSRGGTVQISQLAPFKLEQFYFAFLVLFIGYILALLQFIRERLAYHRNVRRIIVI